MTSRFRSSLPGLLWLIAAICLPVHATTTFDGTFGMSAKIFTANSQTACTTCHSSANTTATARRDAPAEVDFDSWTTTTNISSSYGTTATHCRPYDSGNTEHANCNAVMAVSRITNGTMPYADDGYPISYTVNALNSAEQALASAWAADSYGRYSAPTITLQSVTSITKTSATVRAILNDSGADATYYVDWEVNDGSTADAWANTSSVINTAGSTGSSNSGAVWTGGGQDTQYNALTNPYGSPLRSYTITGLNCGTTYQYRFRGGNSVGSTTNQTGTFSTSACASITTSGPSTSVTEDTLYTQVVTASDPDDSGSLTFSLSSPPSGMTIGSTDCSAVSSCSATVSWTPVNGQTGPYTITVNLADPDAAASPVDTLSWSLSPTAVNDAPSWTTTIASATVAQNDVISEQCVATDEESTVSYSFSSSPDISGDASFSFNTSTCQFGWTVPNDNSINSVNITITASDGYAPNNITNNFTLTLNNNAPVISSTPGTTVTEGSTYTYDINATDSDGNTLTYSVVTSPDISGDASYSFNSSTGLLSWTPDSVDPVNATTINVTASVTDGIDTDIQAYTLNVSPANDAPVLDAGLTCSPASVTELSTFTCDVSSYGSDEELTDFSYGALNWAVSSSPATAIAINGSGVISWSPGQGTAGTYNVSVDLTDNEGASATQRSFVLTVNLLDTDSDTVADYNDNCPTDANTNQANNDGDSEGDVCDLDDDNDGIYDQAETNNGLDPLDPADAAGDLDGDGLTNLQEFQTCQGSSDFDCNAIGTDSVAPVIALGSSVLTVPSTGYWTAVDFDVSASDGLEGSVPVTADLQSPFRPGNYTITWSAEDSAGNQAQASQTLNILPQVSVSSGQVIGEGQSGTIDILLNGDAPNYPVLIDYVVSGTASALDHDLVSGQLAIASGTSGTLNLNTVTDGLVEGDEELVVTLVAAGSNAVLSNAVRHVVTIAESNVAPDVNLQVSQSSENRFQVYQDGGTVTVQANAIDANGDSLSLDWSATDSALGFTVGSNSISFDPAAVTTGAYRVSVAVFDGQLTTVASRNILVATSTPVLTTADTDGDGIDDITEGLGDSDRDGVPDYLDAIEVGHVIGVDDSSANQERVMSTEEGLRLELGPIALGSGKSGSLISSLEVTDSASNTIEDPSYGFIGGVFDFSVHGLDANNPVARVVLPLSQPIPPNAVYRKFQNDTWFTFVENALNAIHSAATVDGLCPALDSDSWQAGLRPANQCVRLTLSDGGPNDEDGITNGVIVDPGGLAVPRETPEQATPVLLPSAESTQGGNVSIWLLLLLMGGGLLRLKKP